MAAVTSTVGPGMAEILHAGKEIAEPGRPRSRGGNICVAAVAIAIVATTARVFDIKDTDL